MVPIRISCDIKSGYSKKKMTTSTHSSDALLGSLIGTAVGDSIGLPFEGMRPERVNRMLAKGLRQRLVFGKGMLSDDTEHSSMVAQALITHPDDPDGFVSSLAWKLRFWLLGLPAGTGMATLKAILKLCVGIPPGRSGVFSAGNGPSMRSPIIGVFFSNNIEKMKRYTHRQSILTHSDPKAEYGACAVALAASCAAGQADISPMEFYRRLVQELPDADDEFLGLTRRACEAAEQKTEADILIRELNLQKGITGYTYHTVPMVLYYWLRYQNRFEEAITGIISHGGDTDTTAAILGGIIGARVGVNGIPASWQQNIIEWPRSLSWLRKIAERLESVRQSDQPGTPVRLFIPGVIIRNLAFLVIVLLHGFRRLLPV